MNAELKSSSTPAESETPQAPVARRVPGLPPELLTEIEAIAASAGLELVQAAFKGGALQIFIDREEGGVTVNDCQMVSRQVSALLDVVDFGRSRYVLEVSSPGLDRQLIRPKDYRRFVGSLARITYRDSSSGQRRTVTGRLSAFSEGGEGSADKVTVEVEETDEVLELTLPEIEIARLEIEL